MTVEITAVAGAIGAEIRHFSSESFVTRESADQCLGLVAEYGVVVYRQAHITDADLVSFSRLLGTVVDAGVGAHPDFPEISPISLDPRKSEIAKLRRSTVYWHTDGVIDGTPQKIGLMAAREISDVGGQTEFANTFMAFKALPAEKRKELARYRVAHSMAAAQSLTDPDPSIADRSEWDRCPNREHPLVWRHRDGRRSLLIGATASDVVGMTLGEGRSLLDGLLAWSTQRRFTLRHQWHVGDLVVWDNSVMLHRAIPYEPRSRRLMHRTAVAGE